jgi:uncharacterized repeat protein (TIGR01451 family)
LRKYSCLLVSVAALLSQCSSVWAQTVGPDLVIAKSHRGNFTAGTNGVYTVVVSNIGGMVSSGPITVTDSLDSRFGFVSATGTGWSCSVTSCLICPNPLFTVHCMSSSVVAAGGSAFPITLTVSTGLSGTVTNGADVAGARVPAHSSPARSGRAQ